MELGRAPLEKRSTGRKTGCSAAERLTDAERQGELESRRLSQDRKRVRWVRHPSLRGRSDHRDARWQSSLANAMFMEP